jgi:uncharacterized cupin superfamily protein
MSVTQLQRQHLWFLDTLVAIPVAHTDGTDGVSVIESCAPCADSPPLHVHHREDEVFHVFEGELLLRVGESEFRLGSGETALAPKGVPHTYRVESPEGARCLVIPCTRQRRLAPAAWPRSRPFETCPRASPGSRRSGAQVPVDAPALRE